jgi:hypothetical protein
VSLLKDGTFTATILIPAVLATLVILASGLPVLAYVVYITRDSLALAFSPAFIQSVTLVCLFFPFFIAVVVMGSLYLYRNRPILQANPVVNQYLGSDGKLQATEMIEGEYREVSPSRQITELSRD